MALDQEILTLKDVSELLQVHQSTVYKLAKEGKDSRLQDRHRLAIPNGVGSALDG
jgi:predicted DNA-binding transcriptional regulator AlpA